MSRLPASPRFRPPQPPYPQGGNATDLDIVRYVRERQIGITAEGERFARNVPLWEIAVRLDLPRTATDMSHQTLARFSALIASGRLRLGYEGGVVVK